MRNGFQRPKVHQKQIGLANQKTQLIFAASRMKANRCGYGLHIVLDSSKKLNSRSFEAQKYFDKNIIMK